MADQDRGQPLNGEGPAASHSRALFDLPFPAADQEQHSAIALSAQPCPAARALHWQREYERGARRLETEAKRHGGNLRAQLLRLAKVYAGHAARYARHAREVMA